MGVKLGNGVERERDRGGGSEKQENASAGPLWPAQGRAAGLSRDTHAAAASQADGTARGALSKCHSKSLWRGRAAQVCLAAERCGGLDFDARRDTWNASEGFHCGDGPPGDVGFWDIFCKVGERTGEGACSCGMGVVSCYLGSCGAEAGGWGA